VRNHAQERAARGGAPAAAANTQQPLLLAFGGAAYEPLRFVDALAAGGDNGA
jgi:hypothetical protein